MPDSPPSVVKLPNGLTDRRSTFDRRLGERRSRTVAVQQDRRNHGDRRRLGNRRESPGGHLRNVLQVIQCLAETEAGDIPLQRSLQRLCLALAEVERLERWSRELAKRLRAAETDTRLGARSP